MSLVGLVLSWDYIAYWSGFAVEMGGKFVKTGVKAHAPQVVAICLLFLLYDHLNCSLT